MSKINPSLKSLTVAISTLTIDPANARKHPERNLEVIKSSLTDFGQRKPIIVRREGMVVEAGNGTLAAAMALGWTDIAAVIVDDDALTATRFSIVDNRSAELAEWDNDNLGTLLSALAANDINLDAMGFNEDEMQAALAGLQDPITDHESVINGKDAGSRSEDGVLRGVGLIIPLTAAEVAALQVKATGYLEINGSLHGFLSHLISCRRP